MTAVKTFLTRVLKGSIIWRDSTRFGLILTAVWSVGVQSCPSLADIIHFSKPGQYRQVVWIRYYYPDHGGMSFYFRPDVSFPSANIHDIYLIWWNNDSTYVMKYRVSTSSFPCLRRLTTFETPPDSIVSGLGRSHYWTRSALISLSCRLPSVWWLWHTRSHIVAVSAYLNTSWTVGQGRSDRASTRVG